MRTKSLDLRGPAGRLEAVLMTPEGEPRAAALLCHAHPLHGGMMHYKLLYRVAKVLEAAGYAVLRFNFRGVGRSEGEHDEGRGEQDDARAALGALRERFPDVPVLLGGYSFGSVVALRAAATHPDDADAVLALGFPVAALSDRGFLSRVTKPRLFVQGENDRFGDRVAIEAVVDELPPPRELVVVPEADHFFTDRIDRVEQAVAAWVGTLFAGGL